MLEQRVIAGHVMKHAMISMLMLTLAVMLANLLTNLSYGYLDPRIRFRRGLTGAGAVRN